jgi:hypothetical protein
MSKKKRTFKKMALVEHEGHNPKWSLEIEMDED